MIDFKNPKILILTLLLIALLITVVNEYPQTESGVIVQVETKQLEPVPDIAKGECVTAEPINIALDYDQHRVIITVKINGREHGFDHRSKDIQAVFDRVIQEEFFVVCEIDGEYELRRKKSTVIEI